MSEDQKTKIETAAILVAAMVKVSLKKRGISIAIRKGKQWNTLIILTDEHINTKTKIQITGSPVAIH